MKRTIKTIGIFVVMGFMMTCSYFLGTTQAEIITEVKTVTEIKEIEKVVEIIPDGYIALEECIPLEDIACYFIDSYDYPCFELKDVCYQLDNDENRSYADIMNSLTDETEDFINNFVDMRQITDFIASDNSLQLYMSDGSGYYWER